MKETNCEDCGAIVKYKTRPPKRCLECAAANRRAKDAERKRKSRKDNADATRTLITRVDKCCQDWRDSGPRRKVCPQHQQYRRITKTVRITWKDKNAGSRHTKGSSEKLDTNGRMPTDNTRAIGELVSDGPGKKWGARVARNPDDWWNDKQLKFGPEIPRSMDESDKPWFIPPTETNDQKFNSIQETDHR